MDQIHNAKYFLKLSQIGYYLRVEFFMLVFPSFGWKKKKKKRKADVNALETPPFHSHHTII